MGLVEQTRKMYSKMTTPSKIRIAEKTLKVTGFATVDFQELERLSAKTTSCSPPKRGQKSESCVRNGAWTECLRIQPPKPFSRKLYEVVCGLQKVEGGRVFEKRARRKARGIKGHWARTILGTQIHPWIHDQ